MELAGLLAGCLCVRAVCACVSPCAYACTCVILFLSPPRPSGCEATDLPCLSQQSLCAPRPGLLPGMQ